MLGAAKLWDKRQSALLALSQTDHSFLCPSGIGIGKSYVLRKVKLLSYFAHATCKLIAALPQDSVKEKICFVKLICDADSQQRVPNLSCPWGCRSYLTYPCEKKNNLINFSKQTMIFLTKQQRIEIGLLFKYEVQQSSEFAHSALCRSLKCP